MDLLEKIIESNSDDIDKTVEEEINKANENSEKIETLGFIGLKTISSAYKGFIPLDARIKYSNLGIETYGMQTTDFIYEFAYYIKENSVKTKGQLIYNIEGFINKYFGMPGKVSREQVFNEEAYKNTETDDEFFEALDNNKIGDLKGKGAALCTEKSAVAQQLLSLFGTESYYCIGCLKKDNNEEPHAFNVVKRKNDYAVLDYSMPVGSFSKEGKVQGYYPFVGLLTNEEFLDFINNGNIKSFIDYEYFDGKKIPTNSQRSYVVGEYKIEKDDKKTSDLDEIEY